MSNAENSQPAKSAMSTDSRFAAIGTSAIHRPPSKRKGKVSLDSRFSRVLDDERFTSHAKVDRYGRRLHPNHAKRALERLYLSEDKAQNTEAPETGAPDVKAKLDLDDDLESSSATESSSSSEYSSSDDDEVQDGDENETMDVQAEDIPEGEVTSRLAVVNLDWDHIQAADLLAVFSSFAPATCQIRRVSVYPSEFGKERMERENVEGPPREIFSNQAAAPVDVSDSDESESSDISDEEVEKKLVKEDDGKDFNSVKLRRYQLERLRYFYAVVECSSAAGAKAIYDLIDGTEYLSSANFFDLRFIPDETDFTDDTPRDVCERLPDRYRPTEFVTDALQHSKVKLSWDADDPRRAEAQKRAFATQQAGSDEEDLQAFLASNSSASESEEDLQHEQDSKATDRKGRESERDRLRGLLGLTSAEAKGSDKRSLTTGEMEVTFSSGLAASDEAINARKTDETETTLEKYVRKEKERKAARKQALKANRTSNGDQTGTTVDAEQDDLGFDDPFFTKPDGQDKKSIARTKKSKRDRSQPEANTEDADNAKERAELELLMASDKGISVEGNHFDKRHLKSSMKNTSKGKRKGQKRDLSSTGPSNGQEGFEMNVSDPRFKAVYERSEFAVDPNHPRFDKTDGMIAVLEESRRKRMRTAYDG